MTAAWCWVGSALAQPVEAPLLTSLELDGAACASAATLEQLVASRSRRIRFVPVPSSDNRVGVRLTRPFGGEPWKAHVVIEGDFPDRRVLEADNCEDLMDATGLVIALSLDPPTASPSEESAGPADEAPPLGVLPIDDVEVQDAHREAQQLASPPWQRRDVLAVGAGASNGLAPGWLPGVSVTYLAIWQSEAGFDVAPAVSLSLNYAARAGFSSAAGEARFELFTMELQSCALRVGTSALGLRPCAWIEAGAVRAEGSRTIEPEQHRRPWLVAGPGLLLHAQLGERVAVLVDLGLGFPFIRDTFQFEPLVLHRVGPWAGQGGVSVGYVLP